MIAVDVVLKEFPPILQSSSLGVARLLIVIVMLPVFAGQAMQGLLRNAVALGLSIPVIYMIYQQLKTGDAHITPSIWIPLLMKEAMIGFLLGTVISLPFRALEAVGTMIDNQRGAATGTQLNPMAGIDGTVLAPIMSQAFATLMFTTGGFIAILNLIYGSFQLWPPLELAFPAANTSVEVLIDLFQRFMEAFIRLSAPPIIIMLLIEGGMALLSVYAPALQVFYLSMPIKSMAVILLLAVYTGIMWQYTYDPAMGFADWIPGIKQLLGR